MTRTRFTAIAAAVLALQVVLAVVSIAANWPSQFDNDGTNAGEEFVSEGTALAPPLIPMLVFALAVGMMTRRGRWGTVGVALVCLLCLVFIAGSLGELFAEPTVDTPRSVLVTSGVLGTLVYGGLLALGARMLLAGGSTRAAA